MQTTDTFEAAFETWRRANDSRTTREVPAFNIFTAKTVECPAFVNPSSEE